ncbi:zinc-ribbon domain-containing protein [Candidatus Weimeria sp. HCP3S3_B5]|uniref:zinc-ribbon domain-containing protein n=1 Tax=Candidatus Weimeria sp. HCP3S3_B5 TaxID=3438871 RepID=UPI003F8A9838
MAFCMNCGMKVPDNARYCPNCGSKIESSITDTDDGEIKEEEEKKRLHQFVWVSSSLGYTPYPCSA